MLFFILVSLISFLVLCILNCIYGSIRGLSSDSFYDYTVLDLILMFPLAYIIIPLSNHEYLPKFLARKPFRK